MKKGCVMLWNQKVWSLKAILKDWNKTEKIEKWKMKNEKWKMKNEKWKMKNEKWKMKNEKWKMKNESKLVLM